MTPDDLGLGGMVKKTGDFIGRRSLFRSDTMRDDRKQLVGLLTDDPKVVLMEGAHVIGTRGGKRAAGADARPGHLELFQPEPRPLDRHGDGEGRAAAHGREALGVAPRRRADPGHRHRHRFSRAAGEARMAELRSPVAARRSPIAPPIAGEGGAVRMAERPFLGKFILRADPQEAVERLRDGARAGPAVRSADQLDGRGHIVPLDGAGRMDAGHRRRGGGGALAPSLRRRARRHAPPARRRERLLHRHRACRREGARASDEAHDARPASARLPGRHGDGLGLRPRQRDDLAGCSTMRRRAGRSSGSSSAGRWPTISGASSPMRAANGACPSSRRSRARS